MFNYGKADNMVLQGGTESVLLDILYKDEKIRCQVSFEAIGDHCGDPPHHQILEIAKEHFDHITDKLGEKVIRGLFEPDGTVILRSADW